MNRLTLPLLLVSVVALSTCASGPSITIEERVPDLELLVAADSNDFIAHYNLGVGYLTKERYPEAMASFETAAELNPALWYAFFAMYCTAYAQDEALYEESIAALPDSALSPSIATVNGYLERAVAIHPFFDWRLSTILLPEDPLGSMSGPSRDIYRVLYNALAKGFREFSLGYYAKAEQSLTRTLDILPDYQEAYQIRGLARALQNNYDGAIQDFQTVITSVDSLKSERILPVEINTHELHYLVGHAYHAQNNWTAARAAFQRTLEEQFGYYMAHYQLALLHRKEGNLAEALQELDAALFAAPDDPILNVEYGGVLIRMSRPREAVPYFERTIAAHPSYALPYFNLAYALEEAGQTEAAQEAYRSFLARASPIRHERMWDIAAAKTGGS
ncbi:MAG: tetratricopeptide repeat protein [Bacteroidota bacterium]